jgi:DNA-binding IclR family transcriptional regulator
MAPPAPNTDGNVPAVSRAIRILGLLAEAGGAPLALTEIARALGIAKSSTSNLLVALEEGRLVERDERGYLLGRRNVELGGAYLRTFDQVRAFYKICTESPVLRQELVQLAVLDRTEVLYLARHEGQAPLRISASIGDRYPASITAVGNALLAALPPAEVAIRFADPATRPRLTERSETSLEGLQRNLEATRRRGYALDEGQVHPMVVGIAMVLPPRASGEAAFAIGASLIDAGLGVQPDAADHRRERVVAELQRVVGLLSNPMLGGQSSEY